MTIIQKHGGNLKLALLDEIEILAKSDVLDKSVMNPDTFNPLSPTKCYMGQIFGYMTKGANLHRELMGKVPHDEKSDYRGSMMGGMTPLETWAAENWVSNKGRVMDVFNYIKSGGEGVLPEIVFE